MHTTHSFIFSLCCCILQYLCMPVIKSDGTLGLGTLFGNLWFRLIQLWDWMGEIVKPSLFRWVLGPVCITCGFTTMSNWLQCQRTSRWLVWHRRNLLIWLCQNLKWLWGTFKSWWNSLVIPLMITNDLEQQTRPSGKKEWCFYMACAHVRSYISQIKEMSRYCVANI